MSRRVSTFRNLYRAMPRSVRYVGLLVLVALCLLLLVIRNPRGLSIPDPRFEREEPAVGEELFPGVVRYVSELADHAGDSVYGLVLEARRGVPSRVLNLTAIRPELGSTLAEFVANGGFDLADEYSTGGLEAIDDRLVELLDPERIGERILSPVDLTLEQLELRRRFVVSVKENFGAARDEGPRRLVAKFVQPTGAYSPVSRRDRRDGSAALLDYGVSLGFVLLEEVDLGRGAAAWSRLWDKIAYFAADDLTHRHATLLEGDTAATRDGSHAGFLPLGPWMVHGRHLEPRTRVGGRDLLRLWLRVREAEPRGEGEWRQYASSSEMALGAAEILALIGEIHATSVRPDADGVPRGVARVEGDRVVLPAGTIVLMGTPPGTALAPPSEADRVRLRFLGNFTGSGARRARVEHYERHRERLGFLSPGDRVEACVERLGCQKKVVTR